MSWFFRKRRVRLHLAPIPGIDAELDFEGVLTGIVDGHYQIRSAKLIQGSEQSFQLDNVVEIPTSRVWWLERLQGVPS